MRTYAVGTGKITHAEQTWDWAGSHLTMRVKIRYSYTVQDRQFDGTRITMADWLFTHGLIAARRYYRQFPVGQKVSVYYNAATPERAVLRRPGYATALFLITSGIVIFLLLRVLSDAKN